MYRLIASQAGRSPLGFYDGLALECDGMMNVVSAVLSRDGIAHRCVRGALTVVDVGRIELHYWITLPSGQIFDIRARMWLGRHENVPHGLFLPSHSSNYEERCDVSPKASELIFLVLSGCDLMSAPPLIERGTN